MNSGLQCLAHTEPLRQYFSVLKLHQSEYNKKNCMATRDNQLTRRFEIVVTKLWNSEKNSAFAPERLKEAIGEENYIYAGFAQQDSSELLQTVLSKVADDINRVIPEKIDGEYEMPYIMNPEDHVMNQMKDECQITLLNDLNLMHDSSIIHELFIS